MTRDPPFRDAQLSRRERQIAAAYADGESHKEIAARLHLAPSTVRTHLGSIYRKLAVSSKVGLRRRLAPATDAQALPLARSPGLEPSGTPRRASVAILPFAGEPAKPDLVARAFARDIITRLAKLRSVRVIAAGSVFALCDRGVGPRQAARLLDVEYIVTGSLLRRDDRLHLFVELAEGRTARVVWADEFGYRATDALLALAALGDRIVASLAAQIEAAERNRALLKPPQCLDAWESFHRGLWHMYRFKRADNEQAQLFFRRAVALDPGFSRAHAGLSFTHFQNAFLLHPEHREREVAQALEAAGESLIADPNDPAAHWAMGRALWLRGENDQATAELLTALELSPNFALGHYSFAFIEAQSGDAAAAIASADRSCRLSPFDPMLFGMLGSRAMALFRLGDYDEAAGWAEKATRQPNAHIHIHAIAAHCLAAADRLPEARRFAARIRRRAPGYRVDDFLTAFRFPPETRALYRKAAERIGLV